MKKTTSFINALTLCMVLPALLTGCLRPTDHKTLEQEQAERMGKITGDGIVLFGGGVNLFNSKSTHSASNNDLWQAAIDTMGLIGIENMDKNSGTIISKWYVDSKGNERMKINAYITSGKLDVRSIRVTSTTEKMLNKNWIAQEEDIAFNRAMEEKIINRARFLKINH